MGLPLVTEANAVGLRIQNELVGEQRRYRRRQVVTGDVIVIFNILDPRFEVPILTRKTRAGIPHRPIVYQVGDVVEVRCVKLILPVVVGRQRHVHFAHWQGVCQTNVEQPGEQPAI